MLVSEIVQSDLPLLKLSDQAQAAMDLFALDGFEQLPVAEENNYLGLLSKEVAEAMPEDETLANMQQQFEPISIAYNQHILSALNIINQKQISLLPVLSEDQQYMGCITHDALLIALQTLTGAEEGGGLFLVEMPAKNFSVGELCRIIETNDAYITQINTFNTTNTGLLNILFRINTKEISDVLATLQRYEYSVKYYFGDQDYENELKENYDHLITYLNI